MIVQGLLTVNNKFVSFELSAYFSLSVMTTYQWHRRITSIGYDKDEMVNHVISEFSKLVQKEWSGVKNDSLRIV